MGLLLAIVAFACGVALVIHLGTGDLKTEQVAGVGLISLALAYVMGIPASTWPWNRP